MWFINPGAKLMLFHKTHFVICTQKFIVCFILQKKEQPYLDWVRDYVECFTKPAVCAPTPG